MPAGINIPNRPSMFANEDGLGPGGRQREVDSYTTSVSKKSDSGSHHYY